MGSSLPRINSKIFYFGYTHVHVYMYIYMYKAVCMCMLIERIVSEIATKAPREESTIKRKKIVLTIEEKLETINLLQKGTSCIVIIEKYGIGQLTFQYITVQ